MSIEERLERLERQNQWMRRLGAVGQRSARVFLLVPILCACSEDSVLFDGTVTMTITTKSLESTYRRASVSARHYDLVATKAIASIVLSGVGDFSGVGGSQDEVEGSQDFEDTEVAGKDYEGHDRISLARDGPDRYSLTHDIKGEARGSSAMVCRFTAEIRFVKGSWAAYKKGEEVEIAYTQAGLDEVSQKFASWMKAFLRQNFAPSGREIRAETTVEKALLSSATMVIARDELRLRQTTPSEFVASLSVVVERQ